VSYAQELVQSAFELLAGGERWARGARARDAAGDPIDPIDPGAVTWSILGAIDRVVADATTQAPQDTTIYHVAANDVIESILACLGLVAEAWDAGLQGALQEVNDYPIMSYEDIIGAVDDAIDCLAGADPIAEEAQELVARARALIASPERWTQGAVARTRHGIEVEPGSTLAMQWSLLGALVRAQGGAQGPAPLLALETLYCTAARRAVQRFNDHPPTCFQHVAELLNRLLTK
jgi:hypothetical protein